MSATTIPIPRTDGTLTYRGRVDPAPGTILGPGITGRSWRVTGAIYHPETNTTTVYTEVIDEEVDQ